MKVFVTGGAGFIGSNLVDRLLDEGREVVAYDNFSVGRPEFLETARGLRGFSFIEGDLHDAALLRESMAGCEAVFHFAANADVRFGTRSPETDIKQNTIATFRVLEAMRANAIARIVFASSSSVYGEPEVFPTPEDAPCPVQTSLYGASKMACEGLIQAYCHGFGLSAWIFRFVAVLGPRYHHGHVIDFCRQLRRDPARLHVLGNGKQQKSYIEINDCLDAILLAFSKAKERINVINVGSDEVCSVDESIAWICAELGVSPHLTYGGGERGWIGDSPVVRLDWSRLKSLGFRPRRSLRGSVIETVRYLDKNPWLLERRGDRAEFPTP